MSETDTDVPWEPPLAGTESEHLIGALDRLRTTFRWKADDLDAAGLQTRIGASTLTLGNLLKHLAVVEDHIFGTKLSGLPMQTTWDTSGWDDEYEWPFTSAADDAPPELYAMWDAAVGRSRARLAAALAEGGLDQPVYIADGRAGTRACGASCATPSRSTGGTPGTPTCCGRRSTAGSARTRRPAGVPGPSGRSSALRPAGRPGVEDVEGVAVEPVEGPAGEPAHPTEPGAGRTRRPTAPVAARGTASGGPANALGLSGDGGLRGECVRELESQVVAAGAHDGVHLVHIGGLHLGERLARPGARGARAGGGNGAGELVAVVIDGGRSVGAHSGPSVSKFGGDRSGSPRG